MAKFFTAATDSRTDINLHRVNIDNVVSYHANTMEIIIKCSNGKSFRIIDQDEIKRFIQTFDPENTKAIE